MPNRLTHLKIKIKSLAAEARMIRDEEKKWRITETKRVPYKDHRGIERVKIVRVPKKHYAKIPLHERPTDHPMRDSLYWHRVGVVREEARDSLIAYGFLRGLDYEQIEENPRWSNLDESGKMQLHLAPDIDNVWAIVERFRGERDYRDVAQKFEEWVQNSNLYHIPRKPEEERVVSTVSVAADFTGLQQSRGLVRTVMDMLRSW
jgi:hypothetical protein